jgi:predicted CXXCH cytochrome family protein
MMKGFLLISSLLAFGLLAYAAYEDNFGTDWYRYQNAYRQRLLARASTEGERLAAERFDVHQKQLYLPDLARADRCVTCHVAIDDPAMAEAPHPLTSHPGELLKIHPREQFGCTICHRGQGRATTAADAHGHVLHWPEPMLPSDELDRSCPKCHLERLLPERARYNAAMNLFYEKACLSCHKVRGQGGDVGPDISNAGKLHDAEWHFKHFKDPKSVVSTSEMPSLDLSDQEAHLLTFLAMSLTGETIPAELLPGSSPQTAQLLPGEFLDPLALKDFIGSTFCIGCHEGTHADAVDGWRQSKMASTYERIKDEPVKENCLPCHTTGLNPETGHYSEEGVGCEACHGPGRQAVKFVLAGKAGEHMKMLRMDRDSKLVCARCHNPHVPIGTHADYYRQLPPIFSVASATPVVEREPGPDSAADPAKTPWMPPGDTVVTADDNAPPTTIEGGCVTSECHAATLLGTFKHGPTAQQQCRECHRLVDEQKHRFEMVEPEPDLCYRCHDRPADTPFTHGPVALGWCTVCHDPHSAPNSFMLLEAPPKLCFTCHSVMKEHVQSARAQHAVIEQEGCTACHDPHRGDFKYQLKTEVPGLCLDCHEPIGEIIDTAIVAHEPVTTDRKCLNCHNPHGSDVPMILVDVEMNLCLDCHDRPMVTPSGPIIDMKSWIESNPERHGPIRESFCTGCHQPHGAQNFRILEHEFPRKFYSPFSLENYALCFECHEETIVLDERTTTLTGFRNGDKNLHYLHVNQEKGRTCRACHEVHAGTKPKRIKDFVPFGEWEYPVNFEINEDGGRCTPGCHVPRGYDRRQEIIQE